MQHLVYEDIVKTESVKVRRYEERRPKKRWLVLRRGDSPILEMFESERRWRAGDRAKTAIALGELFGVSTRVEPKCSHAVVLMGPMSYSLLAESAEQQTDWLHKLRWLHQESSTDRDTLGVQNDRLWDVQVNERDLGSSRKLAGPYCVGLTGDSIRLISRDDRQMVIDIPFITVRGCFHMECFFCVEMGRSSPLGSGKIYMLLEERIYAQNMHEVIKSKFTRQAVTADATPLNPMCARSTSSAADGRTSQSPIFVNTESVHPFPATVSNSAKSDELRLRCDSLPARDRPVVNRWPRGGTAMPSRLGGCSVPTSTNSRSSLVAAVDELTISGSAPVGHMMGSSAMALEADIGSWGAIPSHNHQRVHSSSSSAATGAVNDGDYISLINSSFSQQSQEASDAGYMDMTPTSSPANNSTSSGGGVLRQNLYSPSWNQPQQQNTDYMDMQGANGPSLSENDVTADGYVFTGAMSVKSVSPPPSESNQLTVKVPEISDDEGCSAPLSSPIPMEMNRLHVSPGLQPKEGSSSGQSASGDCSSSACVRYRASSLGSRLGLSSYSFLRRRDRKTDGASAGRSGSVLTRSSPKLSSSWESTFSSLLSARRRRQKPQQSSGHDKRPGESHVRNRSFTQTPRSAVIERWLSSRAPPVSPAVDNLHPVSAAPLQPLDVTTSSHLVESRFDRPHTSDYLNMSAGGCASSISPSGPLSSADSGDYLNMSATSSSPFDVVVSDHPDYIAMDLSHSTVGNTSLSTDKGSLLSSVPAVRPADVRVDEDAVSGDYLEMSVGAVTNSPPEQHSQIAVSDDKASKDASGNILPNNAANHPAVDSLIGQVPQSSTGNICARLKCAADVDTVNDMKEHGDEEPRIVSSDPRVDNKVITSTAERTNTECVPSQSSITLPLQSSAIVAESGVDRQQQQLVYATLDLHPVSEADTTSSSQSTSPTHTKMNYAEIDFNNTTAEQ